VLDADLALFAIDAELKLTSQSKCGVAQTHVRRETRVAQTRV